jgi:hypothetical protein
MPTIPEATKVDSILAVGAASTGLLAQVACVRRAPAPGQLEPVPKHLTVSALASMDWLLAIRVSFLTGTETSSLQDAANSCS